MPVDVKAPKRIWLLDYGTAESCWCDCPDPDYEDHDAVEYVRADEAADTIIQLRKTLTKGREIMNLLVQVVNTDDPDAAKAIVSASYFRREVDAALAATKIEKDSQ